MIIEQSKNLSEWTSWKVGGDADYYCAPQNFDELKEALQFAFKNQLAWTVLGGGTNVLVSDHGIRGLVIHTINLNQIQIDEEQDQFILTAWGGTPKGEVLKHFLKRRLAPAVFLAGLPGDVAGGVVMNAGVGHQVEPKEFHQIVESFEVLSMDQSGQLSTRWWKHNEINWVYRHSSGWGPGIITQVRMKWPLQPDPSVLDRVKDGNKRRKLTQPLQQPSCGSVFKNPPGDHSGRLIEAAGLKGFRVGDAMVSEKHANFIVNVGKATATDIATVIQTVEEKVMETFSVRLSNEVIFFGDWSTQNKANS